MDVSSLHNFLAPEVIFGIDARLQVGRYLKNWTTRKVLLVTDASVELAGWVKEITQQIEQLGLEVAIFRDISPNPRDYEIMIGADFYKDQECDGIVAVGGGSVLDAAKGIAIVVSCGGNILDYEGVDRVLGSLPPLICIPTTGGTSADVSRFCIVNDTRSRCKIAIISKAMVPNVALVDPKPLTTMSDYLTGCTGVDAIVHAMEAFVSNQADLLTDSLALKAMSLLSKNLLQSIKDPDNLDYREQVMLGSFYAGLAFSSASLGCNHSLAHSIGGYLDLPHGECNALLLPQVVDFNYSSAEDRYLRLGEGLGMDWRGVPISRRRKRLVLFLKEMTDRLGIHGSLKNRGLHTRDVAILAQKAIKDPCNATNPKKPNVSDLELVLEESL
jgi:alcohol dehydrogenase class IV